MTRRSQNGDPRGYYGSGVMMPKGQTERRIFITADSWVPESTRLCFAVEGQAGGQCSAPVVIHVRKDSPLAEAGK